MKEPTAAEIAEFVRALLNPPPNPYSMSDEEWVRRELEAAFAGEIVPGSVTVEKLEPDE
jgi:hypothetical protein